jgi:hypothetical protein
MKDCSQLNICSDKVREIYGPKTKALKTRQLTKQRQCARMVKEVKLCAGHEST